MKRITIAEATKDFDTVLALAEQGLVVLLAPNGKEYVIAPADDFAQEVEHLRHSATFQQFLDDRSAKKRPRRPLSEIAREIEVELARQRDEEG